MVSEEVRKATFSYWVRVFFHTSKKKPELSLHVDGGDGGNGGRDTKKCNQTRRKRRRRKKDDPTPPTPPQTHLPLQTTRIHIMALKFNTVIPPAPTTVRGQPLSIGAYKKKNSIVYGNGLFVYVRDITNGDVKAVHRHKVPVTMARVCPSQCYCASGDREGNIVVWALDNEQNTVKLETKVTSGPINDICFTGDNQRLVAVGESKESFGAALLVDGGSTVGSISGHVRTIQSCDMRLERPFRCATGSEDTEVNFYEGPPFKLKQNHKNHSNTVNCVRFHPSGDRFVTVARYVMYSSIC